MKRKILVFSFVIITSLIIGEVFALPGSSDRTDQIDEKEIEIAFLGDVMMGRYVESLMDRHGHNYPFEKLEGKLNDFDLVIANLEGPISYDQDHKKTSVDSVNFSFKEIVTESLKMAGIDIVNLSNNHTFDQEEKGFKDTVEILKKANIEWFGHPEYNTEEHIKRIELEGIWISLIGFHQATKPFFEEDLAEKTVAKWRGEFPEDIIIVNLHHGPEYIKKSSLTQQRIARAMIDSGADMVIGHHPHVVQEMEMYNEKPIFYSLGNFVFDQYFSRDVQEGLVVVLKIVKTGEEIKLETNLEPIKSIRSQPFFLEGASKIDWINNYQKEIRN